MHQRQTLLQQGAALENASTAMIMLHGRGGTAADILALSNHFEADGMVYLAPEATNQTWYPNRFLSPVASNEPWLTSALTWIEALLGQLAEAGIAAERTFLLGFSQGACLSLEFAARHPQRYAGVIALSGALIENGDKARSYPGSLDGTPIFLGCSDVDFHIPKERVERSAQLLRDLHADVNLQIYPNMGHVITLDEVQIIQKMIGLSKRLRV